VQTQSNDPRKSKKAEAHAVNSYPNLPPEQGRVQRLVDQFNADENIWRRLAVKRRLRRLSRRGLLPKWHELFDLVELHRGRPREDAIGFRERR
jgi:hypothetical protein